MTSQGGEEEIEMFNESDVIYGCSLTDSTVLINSLQAHEWYVDTNLIEWKIEEANFRIREIFMTFSVYLVFFLRWTAKIKRERERERESLTIHSRFVDTIHISGRKLYFLTLSDFCWCFVHLVDIFLNSWKVL